MQRIIRREGVEGLSYGEFNGYLPLRKTICQIMASNGMVISPDNILITTGSQQAISLVAQALLKNGDNVIVENAVSLQSNLLITRISTEEQEYVFSKHVF